MKWKLAIGVVALSPLLMTAFASTKGGDATNSSWKAFLSKSEFQTLVKRETAAIGEHLKGDPGADQLRLAQYRALLLAGYALSMKQPGPHFQDQGLAFAKMVRSGSPVAELRTFAKQFETEIKIAKPTKKVKWKAYADLIVLMRPTDFKSKGGEGLPKALQSNKRFETSLNSIEEKLRYLARRPLRDTYMQKEAAELKWWSYRLAVLGSLTDEFLPRKGDPKVWHSTALKMRDAGIEMGRAAEKKDADALHKAATRLEASCYECHKVFRTPTK